LHLDTFYFFFQAEDGIRDLYVTGVQTCALPISERSRAEFLDNLERLRLGLGASAFLEFVAKFFRQLVHATNEFRARNHGRRSDRSEERRVGKECRERGSAEH